MVALLDTDVPLKRKNKVVATTDLPGVPEGTEGKILLINGFAWIRYRVLFENGVDIGTLDRKYLATHVEYSDLLERRARGDFDVVETDDAETIAEDEADEAASSGDGGATVNGVMVPAHLLERSKARREALGVPK